MYTHIFRPHSGSLARGLQKGCACFSLPFHRFPPSRVLRLFLLFSPSLPLSLSPSPHTGVCETNTPSGKKDSWADKLSNTKSGAAEQFLLSDCKAKVRVKGVLFSQTPVDCF